MAAVTKPIILDETGQDIVEQLQALVANTTSGVDDVRQNGVSKVTNRIANITVPTKVSDLANDAGFQTEAQVQAIVALIQALIPSQATAQNQLADKAFVNSTVGTNTANYISDDGQPFTSVSDLPLTGITNNDYAFVTGTDTAGNTYYDRYKASVSAGSATWSKEYRLNNSAFTAVQWAAIESGITSGDVELIQLLDGMSEETWTFTYDDDTTRTVTVLTK